MAQNTHDEDAASEPAAVPAGASDKAKTERREIKGGLPYTVAPGVLKKALDLIVTAERPDKFSTNYMATILKLSGGAARAVPPFLKKMQFIAADGAPTTLYSQFKTDGGRSRAAYEGLRNAFGELFKRNEFIHKADESTVRDLIVEITGLKKNDQIVRLIYASFDAIRGFIAGEVASPEPIGTQADGRELSQIRADVDVGRLGLSYQINIVLPETENISVFDAIFRSLRENLLR
jgi:hypothetical protein